MNTDSMIIPHKFYSYRYLAVAKQESKFYSFVKGSIRNSPMQKFVMTCQDWWSIYLYSSARGIMVDKLISMKFGTNQIHLYVICHLQI